MLKRFTIILTTVILSFSITKSVSMQNVEAVINVDLQLEKMWPLSNPSLYQMKFTATPPQAKQTIQGLIRNDVLRPVSLHHIFKNAGQTLYWKNEPQCQEARTVIHHLFSIREGGGYCWPQEDQLGVSHTGQGQWVPQSIASIPDFERAYNKGLAVGWYKKGVSGSEGTRLSLIHAPESKGTNLTYANILFALISGSPGHFEVSDVELHTGGFGWYQDHLFMADTDNGLRVFDMNHIYEVSTGKNTLGVDPSTGKFYAHNYQYVIFQSGRYTRILQGPEDTRNCSRKPEAIGYHYCFSTLSVDRTSHPASLITAEYRRAAAMRADYIAGEPMRIVRWPLEHETGLLATGTHGVVTSNQAYGTWTERVQGAVSHDGIFYLASSLADREGKLYVSGLNETTRAKDWVVGPEDLSHEYSQDRLWSLTEHVGKRMLFWVKR